ncbi:MAG: TauD/TfdA family dioxygenase [Moorea sp. SIOASIH]|uniref:TauD/TfdA family dioxygenase n=1 Tax=Moorena sp. SIOASIH TaxID=2607817 RepID=UPI0013BE2039|nr:TauD/TfdA family dioxygenase [Moorena sp. SIOASIH]NEO36429.1 TauD/TfdA family dioxygenase [Moorena sp. SIOASIH]
MTIYKEQAAKMYLLCDPKSNVEHNIVEAHSIKDLNASTVKKMFKLIKQFGYFIIQLRSSQHKENLLELSQYFGSIVKHEHSDKQGIVPVTPLENSPGYVNTTTTELPLHTDGSFAVDPPKIVALQCEVAVAIGGLTTIGDGRLLYDYLTRTNPCGLLNLFQPDAITVQRENRQSTKPIFEEHESRIRIRFRWDDAVNISVKPEDLRIIKTIKYFFNRPENMLQFKLQPQQIIIMDNSRILHGRTAFNQESKRLLNRVWFDGKSDYSEELCFGFSPRETLEELKQKCCL